MEGGHGGNTTDQSVPIILSNFEVNTVGLHVLLYTAQELGFKGGVQHGTNDDATPTGRAVANARSAGAAAKKRVRQLQRLPFVRQLKRPNLGDAGQTVVRMLASTPPND